MLKVRKIRQLFKPRSREGVARRRELILNVLLGGLISVAILALIVSLIGLAISQNYNGLMSILVTLVFLALLLGCRWAVRAGYLLTISYGFVLLLMATATQLIVEWSFVLPQALLMYVLVVVVAGILLGARAGLAFTAVALVLLLGTAAAQTNGLVHPDLSWYHQEPVLIDAIGYGLVIAVVGLVSWLSSREIDHAFARAQRSEAALLVERDNLERKVVERTRELEQSQWLRIMELERFAAFGKISASLVHEMANPLMAATLNMEQLNAADHHRLAGLSVSLSQIERQLTAARRQLRGDPVLETFSVTSELNQVVRSLRPLARRHQVTVKMPKLGRLSLQGDSVKFSQIVSNLIANAIEAYPPEMPGRKRSVSVEVVSSKRGLRLSVCDWGGGITTEDMPHIFDPFYSKKPSTVEHSGAGIGLGIVKQFVEQDFGGTIKVTSSPSRGTRFTVSLLPQKTTAAAHG